MWSLSSPCLPSVFDSYLNHFNSLLALVFVIDSSVRDEFLHYLRKLKNKQYRRESLVQIGSSPAIGITFISRTIEICRKSSDDGIIGSMMRVSLNLHRNCVGRHKCELSFLRMSCWRLTGLVIFVFVEGYVVPKPLIERKRTICQVSLINYNVLFLSKGYKTAFKLIEKNTLYNSL